MADKLKWALTNGQMDDIRATLVKAEDINRPLEGGRWPLHIAADYGQTEVVEYLISKGGDVNAQDKFGMTPLVCACYEGHLSCIKLLLTKGADKTCKGLEAIENEEVKALLK